MVLAILSAIFGFLAPMLPEVLKLFNRRMDNQHEKDMMELRLQHAQAEHAWRMEEVEANADIAEAAELHKPAPSFGVQLLDAAQNWGLGRWVLIPAFYLFTVLDFLSGMVRPTIAFSAFGFYIAYKWALYDTIARVHEYMPAGAILEQVWQEQDWAVLTLVLSYWFGHRAAKAAFGGSAMTAARGA